MNTPTIYPESGARFLLELEPCETTANNSAHKATAIYHCAIYTPDNKFPYRLELEAGHGADILSTGEKASQELEKKLVSLAKLLARNAARNIEEKMPPWPKRILRWRGPK